MSKDQEKLDELSEKIAKTKDKIGKKEVKEQDRNSFLYASKMGLRIGMELFSGVLVGGCIGRFLDISFNKSPIFLIIFLFLGCIAGILNIYKFVKSREEENK